MTDAAVPVTQSAVERFSEQYLRSLGCTIEKREDEWEVTVPADVDAEIPKGQFTLLCTGSPDEIENNEKLLHPESEFVQKLIADGSERTPMGKMSIDTNKAEIEPPGWLENSVVTVSGAQFTPYYDRRAIVVLFRVSIETVSEYQSELLRTVALDARSGEHLPQLEKRFLDTTNVDGERNRCVKPEFEKVDVSHLLDSARGKLVDLVQPTIDDIHEEASRAADAEVEEYRRMQQQKIEELEREQNNLSEKIDELRDTADGGEQDDRIQMLKKRKELKSELTEVDSSLTELRQRRERGFPDKQRDIRNRHALDVRITPLTVTQVDYERGEAQFQLIRDGVTNTVTVGYGSGIGVTDTVQCTVCERELTEQNSLQAISDGLGCEKCSSGIDT